jgi:hypothetical protein
MTTLRRLLVAVYPIRLFVLALAAWGVAVAMDDVRAQSPVNVGYYDIAVGAGIPEQVAPVVAAGFTPVALSNVAAADLAGLQVLFVHNPNTMGYNAEYLAAVPQIRAAVEAGLVLVVHDRSFSPLGTGTRLILPLPVGVPFPVLTRVMSNDNNVTDPATLVANGPGGVVTNMNLDGGNFSNLGFVMFSLFTAPGKKALLHAGNPNSAVTFSYPLGLGHVIYSSIPLDMFLKGGGPNPPRCNFNNIYAPNVLAYAANLKGLPQGLPQPTTLTVSALPAPYGGATTLSATLKSGTADLSCRIVNFSLNGLAVGSALTDPSGTATLPNVSIGPIAAGNYPDGVRADFAEPGLLTASFGTTVLEVSKAPLSVTADDKTTVYGAELPAFSAHYNGFVLGESPAVLEGALAFATPATQGSPAGAYAITPYGLTSNNYDITFNDGTLTVDKAHASIAFAGGSFVYDGTPHAATGSVTGVFGESLGTPSFTYTDQHGVTSDAAPVNAGVYGITAASAETDNYLAATLDSGATITIAAAPLKVRADDRAKVYGAALPELTASYEGLVAGETPGVLGGTLSLTTAAAATSAVGAYPITASGLTSTNYDITFVNGTLDITPAPLTVRAGDASKIYGAALPAFTESYEGFVLGETPGVLGGTLNLTTDAGVASAVGRYPITASGLTSTNYGITFVSGELNVTPAALTIRADNSSKIYGAPLPVFTASYDGLVLGEAPGVLGGTLSLTTTAGIASAVGSYPITISGLTSPNYAITFVNGLLDVTRAALTVRARDQERLVGLPNPALTVDYEGFVAGDTAASLDVQPSVTTAAMPSSTAGTYPIVVGGAADSNYTIEHVNGTLTVSPEGRMHGTGFKDAGDARNRFSFDVRERTRLGEKGSFALWVDRGRRFFDDDRDDDDDGDDRKDKRDPKDKNDRKAKDDFFVSRVVTSVTFSDDPDILPGRGRAPRRNPLVDTVKITGTGYWNGVAAVFEATVTDAGEPGARRDTLDLTVRVAGKTVARLTGPIDRGNVQSNRLPGR